MDNLNLEKLFNYLKKNYLVLSLGVLFIVSLSTFYFLYSANQKNKTFMSQELYKSYLNELSTFDGAEIEILESKLNELKNNNSSSIYYYLANFYQVKIYFENNEELKACLLYTSDAADD